MQNRILTRIIIAHSAVLLSIAGASGMAQPFPGQDSVVDCIIQLDGIHQSVSCLETAELIPPVALSSCGAAVALSHKDQYFNLGCTASGFQGYFALSRWAVSTIQGDGGVDVTGAPNSLLVEGANSASVVVAPESAASLRVAIPAYGFVSFDWGYIGGSNLFNKAFWIAVNGERTDELKAGNTAGNFFFGPLEAGDVLALNTSADKEGFRIELANFEFHSNAMGVIEREWKAEDEAGRQGFFTQWVSIKKPDLSLVTFPGNFDGLEFPVLNRSASVSPEWAGYPVIDKDGLLSTMDDQFPLIGSRAPFDISWKDVSGFSQGLCTILREWTVTDRCGDNVLQHTQLIMLHGECPESSEPLPFGHHAYPGNPGYSAPGEMSHPMSSTGSLTRDSLEAGATGQ